jgi:carbonic anhydrase
MKKLLAGIVKFRRDVLPNYRETFARLALGQTPDTLYIGCSDSRVAVNVFASTDPGDLFVIRNVGNLVPPADEEGVSTADESEAAAIEFALKYLNVTNIVICGHSECGAMQALLSGRQKVEAINFRAWLRHGDLSLTRMKTDELKSDLPPAHRLSQLNVLQQIEHLKTFPIVQERLLNGTLTLHGWWFEVNRADVYAYEAPQNKFVLIDEETSQLILARMKE